MYGVCRVCGCTESDPCFHPDYGMCWWVDETHELCSHCADPDIADSPDVIHCINTLEETQYCDLCSHYDEEDCSCMLDGDCEFEDINERK